MQELVFTRDAFNARLEIENGERSDLVSIKVEMHIKRTFGQGELANDVFSVGKHAVKRFDIDTSNRCTGHCLSNIQLNIGYFVNDCPFANEMQRKFI